MDEWLQRMSVFQRGSYQAKQLSTSEIMGAVQKSEGSCSFYENLWYSTTRILCALFSTSVLTAKCTWHDFACIIWVKGTLAFGDLCLVMKRRNQNIQVTQERKLIKLPSHECNLFVWKDKRMKHSHRLTKSPQPQDREAHEYARQEVFNPWCLS